MPKVFTTSKKLDFAGVVSILLGVPFSAAATNSIPVPEPSILGLLAAGAVAGLVVWVRNRRK